MIISGRIMDSHRIMWICVTIRHYPTVKRYEKITQGIKKCIIRTKKMKLKAWYQTNNNVIIELTVRGKKNRLDTEKGIG